MVTSFLVKGSDLFASSNPGGIFRSTDDGARWSAVDSGLSDTRIWHLASSGHDLYAATNKEIFRSTDDGNSWHIVGGRLDNTDIDCLSAEGTTIFAGTNSGILSSGVGGSGLYLMRSGAPNTSVEHFAAFDANLYAATSRGVFVSTDNGASWKGTAVDGLVGCLTVSGKSVFAGGSGMVIRTTDKGTTWHASTGSMMYGCQIYSITAKGAEVFASGSGFRLFRSTDGGATWAVTNGNLRIGGIQFLALHNGYLFAATNNGVFRSTDDGVRWTETDNGLINSTVNALTVVAGAHGKIHLLAGTSTGVYLSGNSSRNWSHVGLRYKHVLCLAVSANLVFAGTYHGVYSSANGGAAWNDTLGRVQVSGFGPAGGSPNPDENRISSLAVHDSIVLAGGSGLFISTDNWTSWTRVKARFAGWGITSLLFSGRKLLASTARPGGVFLSTDFGKTWTGRDSGLHGQAVLELSVCDTTLYARSYLTAFCSADEGQRWRVLGAGVPCAGFSYCEVNGKSLIAGFGKGVYFSTDGGLTWHDIDENLKNIPVKSLAVSGSYLYAGTLGFGVWRLPLAEVSRKAQ